MCLGQELASWLDQGPKPGNLVYAMNRSCNKQERVRAHALPQTSPPCADLSWPWWTGGVFRPPLWVSPQPVLCPVTLTWSDLGQRHRGRTCLRARSEAWLSGGHGCARRPLLFQSVQDLGGEMVTTGDMRNLRGLVDPTTLERLRTATYPASSCAFVAVRPCVAGCACVCVPADGVPTRYLYALPVPWPTVILLFLQETWATKDRKAVWGVTGRSAPLAPKVFCSHLWLTFPRRLTAGRSESSWWAYLLCVLYT